MKNVKISLLLSALVLATSSYAETTNSEEVAVNTRDQCGYYYRETLSHPVIKRDAAVTVNKEAAQYIQLKRQFAEEYLMNADIGSFSPTGANYDFEDSDQILVALSMGDILSQSEAVKELISLFGYYYLGEYVPKDDYQAIAYLEKLVEYYKTTRPEYVDELILGVAMSLDGGISKANPLWTNDDPTQVFNLLIKAGSIETEAMMIDEDFDSSDADCVKNMLPKIEALANQGSRLAIHRLAKYYKKLSAKGTEADNEKMMYWQQKAEEKPLIGIKWSI
ncbi:hypothetical protein [Psychrobacter sp. AOP31-E1-50]|uniref:hypothetical protein n=1 Tax=Psychrobacter sp. AOP31-E1-50 TaxID=3457692 RepID=UPI0040352EE1